jgi:Fic family protein
MNLVHSVNERQRLIVHRMLDNFQGHATTSKYARFAKCSFDTALRDMREFVARHILIFKHGGGRSTRYRLVRAGELEQSDNGVIKSLQL